ncbi:rhomboid family intramembrane serine protease [Mucilaginibacter terrae]|uniref:Membrane associated rhomboid family serine protease n=1 Tax=Mucilaginibacter terrae TaxID=1955052 RepID=A0ABU3GP12_9SPHI|nr:rhomboid family intramembrane serine protease [Mucilaginibacter terrae]MDT3401261.1 membrane associated rhomboid family serine protease [Mucilaginibacter terrae]
MIRTIKQAFLLAPACYFLMALITIITIWGIKNKQVFFHLLLHPGSIVGLKEHYRLVTGDFVHNDLAHLAINQMMLFTFGTRLEEYLIDNGTWHDHIYSYLCLQLSYGRPYLNDQALEGKFLFKCWCIRKYRRLYAGLCDDTT